MKNNFSLTISTILTSILIVFLTIYSELNESFKNYIASFTTHHWISKSILTIIFFIVFYLIFSLLIKNTKVKPKHIYFVILFTILSYLAIIGFFVFEFLTN